MIDTVTVYADVLIVLNIYVNFFLLRVTARLTRSALRTKRCIIGAVFGSLFSLMILAPPMSIPVMALFRLGSAAAVTAAAFGGRSIRRLLVNTGAFFTANLILAGAVHAADSWLRPGCISTGNGFFYVDFSLILLLAVTAGLYIIVCTAGRFFRTADQGEWKVVIRCRGRIVSVTGLADTGNLLTDFFTGLPVVICGKEVFYELTGSIMPENGMPEGMRVIPCSTVSESGLIPVLRPDELLIIDTETGQRKSAGALVGFGNCGRRAVFHPELIKY